MAKYKLEISRTAERQLKKLPREGQKRVVKTIRALADEPLPKGCRKLSGYDDVFRVRVGRYRVIYSVSGRNTIIIFLKAFGRKEAYGRATRSTRARPAAGRRGISALATRRGREATHSRG